MEAWKFLVTEESGRLARWLRLMGCDARLAAATRPSELYRWACNEQRVIVTRNRRVVGGRLVRVVTLDSARLEEQLAQLKRDLGLAFDEARAFTRCDQCNAELRPVSKTEVEDRVPPFVYQTQDAFRHCPVCDRIYWAATHAQRIRQVLEKVAA